MAANFPAVGETVESLADEEFSSQSGPAANLRCLGGLALCRKHPFHKFKMVMHAAFDLS
jgi:hypothetical protein